MDAALSAPDARAVGAHMFAADRASRARHDDHHLGEGTATRR
jgi:hypothetical protein